MTPLFIVTRQVGEETWHLVDFNNGDRVRWMKCDSASYWLTSGQVERLRQDPWWGEDLQVAQVSNGPWPGYWLPGGRAMSCHLNQLTASMVSRDPPVGPLTMQLATKEETDVWWAWQTPRNERPGLCYKTLTSLGVAAGSLETARACERRGTARILRVKLA